MIKIYLLVVSLWGFNGSTWVYTGNQMVYQEKFYELEVCQEMGRKWLGFELNEAYSTLQSDVLAAANYLSP